ncbi:cation:proton antiporter [Phaeobacter sp. QD34_3]|uniref:cation:proton antiporter n=1 Tax=unclassified Phaeobacter TaxID=2621772 RepID=UPI00237F3093|nr:MULTISPECIES: cation:proton antiporter [unclassified Phaeobacter]MDE4131737.1 cation:proton antiporter [Phaeobacter sp. QD34_3]MDE4135174.1 cation:proton antiporter [Phaeobacter sp. QD34_24]
MKEQAVPLIVLGLLFFAGLAADRIGRRLRLPRVTLLLGFGLLVGEAGFGLLPETITTLYPVVAVVALSAVALLLGSELSLANLGQHGRTVLVVSLSVVLVTQLVVSAGLWLIGVPLTLAIVLGALATATDPAATYDVIDQSGQDSSFTRTLKGLVAIDDAWGLLAFSAALVMIQLFSGIGTGGDTLARAAYEVFGSIALGCVIGVPGALLTGRLSDGEPLRIEALSLVFLTAGLSLMLDLSYLIAGMTVGAVIVNLAHHHTRAFHEIRNFEWPFMIIFFVLAGATLDPSALASLGLVGVGYALLRILGRIIGGWIGGTLAQAPRQERPYYGAAMLPQAGVAIGMALAASEQFPEFAPTIMALAIGTTAGFELIGPIIAALTIAAQARAEGTR